jgi:outer membrane protein assembly factor BamB
MLLLARSSGCVRWILVAAVAAASFGVIRAAEGPADGNWPQWRGPNQTGAAPQANPPTQWGENRHIKWKVRVPGEGSSTPVIWGDKVFVLTAIATGKAAEPVAAAGARNSAAGTRPQRPGGSPPRSATAPAPGNATRSRFASAGVLVQRWLAAGDKNADKMLSAAEFAEVIDTWFTKLDTEKAGRLDAQKLGDRLGGLLADAATPNNRDLLVGRVTAGRLLPVADTNQDESLTREEWKAIFGKWFVEWDSAKAGVLGEESLRDGLSRALGRPDAPPGGFPGGDFGGGPGGFAGGRGGFGGAPPTERYQFAVVCLDRNSGKTLWQRTAREDLPHQGHHPSDGSFAAASPVTDGTHVYAYFGSRGLYCYDLSGELKWSQDLGDMQIAMSFGEGSSPTLAGDAVIVNFDHEGDSFVIALDKRTGSTLWKKPRDERTSWSTPIAIEHAGRTQVITTASNRIRSYDAASGELIWECSGLTRNVIPSPVAGDGVVYGISGFQGAALLAIRVAGAQGDVTSTDHVLWRYNRNTPYVPSPLLSDGRLYFYSSNNGVLTSIDAATGRVLVDAQRVAGLRNVYASPVAAGGHIYLVGRDGSTVVVKDAGQLDVVATNRLEDRFDASPAVSGNAIFLRGKEYLYCVAGN